MKKVLILVEGQTEEQFVKRILNPHLSNFNIYTEPKIITTKKVKSGPDYKGGIKSHGKVKREINILLKDSSAAVVTTMIDYYHLPPDFPGRDTMPASNCFSRVSYLENEFAKDIDNPKFIPYLQLHEFEALLFSCIAGFKKAFPGHHRESQLRSILKQFNTPEEIDEGNITSPAKRIVNLFPEYKKTIQGILISLEIGIEKIRNKCRHFNEWLERLLKARE